MCNDLFYMLKKTVSPFYSISFKVPHIFVLRILRKVRYIKAFANELWGQFPGKRFSQSKSML